MDERKYFGESERDILEGLRREFERLLPSWSEEERSCSR